MIKEELEKEAEEKYVEVDREFIACQDEGEVFNIGYVLGAEPREKRIEELEKEKLYYKDIVETNSAEWEEQGQRVVTLEKENAELENKLIEKVTLESLDIVSAKINGLENNLTKAKELLKQWLQTSKASGCDNINIVADTEQFLKGE